VMALGIATPSATFSVAVHNPDRLVTLSSLWNTNRDPGAVWKQVSIPDFQDWHDQSTVFDAMAYYSAQQTSVMSGAASQHARVTRVSPEFFHVFGIEPAIGRFFNTGELQPGGDGAVVISHSYWQGHFAGNARALGQTIRIFEKKLTIVGVLPAGFRFPEKTDIWFPADTITQETAEWRAALNYLAVARLKADVSLDQAQAQLTGIAERLEREYPQSNEGKGVAVARLREDLVSRENRPSSSAVCHR
jgi:hypothetical protein